MNLSLIRHIFLSSLILILAGCQSRQDVQQGAPQGEGPIITQHLPPQAQVLPDRRNSIKVAMLVPLSGREANLGQALFNAAQLSLFENAPDQIELVVEDTRGDPSQAARAAEKVLNQGAKVIIGPLFSSETQAVARIAAQHNVPVLTFSNNHDVAGGNVYILGFMPGQQIFRLLDVARGNGINTVGILVPRNQYGQLIRQQAEKYAKMLGVNIGLIEEYMPGSTDMSIHASRILQSGVGAILIPEGGEQLKIMVSSLLHNQVDPNKVRLLGTGQWDTPDIYQNATLAGAWFVSGPISMREQFIQSYQKTYGTVPPRLATLAYDAISMVSYLANNSPQPNSFPVHMLTQPRGYQGIDGIFKLSPDGTVQRGLAVYEITAGSGLTVVSPAPRGF